MKHPNFREAQKVIETLQDEFDSHEFIKQFVRLFERQYVEELCDKIDCENIFQSYHAQIGRFLMDNSVDLKIRKNCSVMSENIKDNMSENAKWINLSRQTNEVK